VIQAEGVVTADERGARAGVGGRGAGGVPPADEELPAPASGRGYWIEIVMDCGTSEPFAVKG
jgi:hypothetical protein